MTVRLGMSSLILELRRLTDTEENDTTINGVAYWTDLQLQEKLDDHAIDINDVLLEPRPLHTAGVWEYKRYYIPKNITKHIEYYTDAEQTANQALDVADQLDETQYFFIVNDLGNVVTNYTYTPSRRLIEFDTDQLANSYYIRAVGYNMNESAREVWLDKAAHRTQLVRWKAGEHQLHEDQEWEHCMKMAEFYGINRGLKTVDLVRTGYRNAKL